MKKTGAGGEPQDYDSKNGRYINGGTFVLESDTLPNAKRLVERYERSYGSVENRITGATLHKSEWRRYYDAIGQMQAGTLRTRKTKGGKRWVILNTNVLQNGIRTPPRILLDNGSFLTPRVSAVMTFANDDEMYDALDIWSDYE